MELSQLGASGAVVVVVILFLKYMKDESEKRERKDKVREANADKRNKLLVKAIDKNTSITENADKYLRERNGRDNEVHAGLMKQIKEIPKVFYSTEVQRTKEFKAIMEALPTAHPNVTVKVGEQKVEHQEVANQDVKNSKRVDAVGKNSK